MAVRWAGGNLTRRTQGPFDIFWPRQLGKLTTIRLYEIIVLKTTVESGQPRRHNPATLTNGIINFDYITIMQKFIPIAKTWRTFAKLMCFRDKILGQFQGLKIHDWQLIYINYYQCFGKSRTKHFKNTPLHYSTISQIFEGRLVLQNLTYLKYLPTTIVYFAMLNFMLDKYKTQNAGRLAKVDFQFLNGTGHFNT